jgi:hypothetical protein
MRATACALAGLIGLAACGDDDDHANRARPASSINVTAAIIDGRIHVSPERFGAGPIRLIVTNQTDRTQAVTLETAGDSPGITRSSGPIDPSSTATLEADVQQGEYAVSTDDDAIPPASPITRPTAPTCARRWSRPRSPTPPPP